MATSAEILDLDTLQRTEHYEFTLLDRALNQIEIDSDDGRLHPAAGSVPTIVSDGTAHITRSLQGVQLTPKDANLIDPIGHRLQVHHVLPEASDVTHRSLGIFMFQETPRRISTRGRTTTFGMIDQSLILDQPRQYNTAVNTGFPALAGAELVAVTQGIPGDRIIADIDTTPVSANQAWRPGENALSIIREMAALGHPMFVYWTNDGYLRFRKIPDDLDVLTPDQIYTAGTSRRLRVLGDGYDETDDLWQAPNLYVVTNTDADNNLVTGEYRLPASAPHSIENRGFVVARVIEEQGTSTSDLLHLRAIYAYLQDNRAMKYIEFEGPADPRHDTYDIVEFMGDNYIELRWSLPLVHGGRMTHRLARLYLSNT